jgi:hypothetical protein
MEHKKLRPMTTISPPSKAMPVNERQRAIARGLQKLFDDVVSEPVPDELLQILENADKRGSPK